MKKIPIPPKADLVQKFITDNKTIENVAKEYGIRYNVVFKWLKSYGIKKHKELLYGNRTNRYKFPKW